MSYYLKGKVKDQVLYVNLMYQNYILLFTFKYINVDDSVKQEKTL